MKKIPFLMFLLVIVPLFSAAQDINPRIREVGISLSGPYTFGIRYRSGNENTLLRLTLLSINGNNHNNKTNSDPSSKNGTIGFGLNIGFEKRKMISNNLSFYSGSDLLMSYSRENYENPQWSQNSKYWAVSPGIGVVLGFIYKISSDINISAEVVPSIVYSYNKSTDTNNGTKTVQIGKGFNYGLTNSVGNLTLSFRLGKKN